MFNEAEGQPNELREWTLMFYFASDNPLSPGVVSQLKALKDAGFHKDANVLARFDPHTLQTPTHIFDVNLIKKLKSYPQSDVGFTDNDPFVRNLVSDKLWGDEVVDGAGKTIREQLQERFKSENITYDPPQPPKYVFETALAAQCPLTDCPLTANPSTANPSTADPTVNRPTDEPNPTESLTNFLKFCRQFYPARHYMLFILGHGVVVGNDLFLYDEHAAGAHSVSLTNLGTILTEFARDIQNAEARKKGVSGEFELVSFHSCSMSGLEVAYELKDSAKYMLASQGPAFVGSWPYRQILIRIFNDLNRSSFAPGDLRGLASRILAGGDVVFTDLKRRLDAESPHLLERISKGEQLEPDALKLVMHEFNALLEAPDLYEKLGEIRLLTSTNELLARHKEKPFEGTDLKRLNRQLIVEAFHKELNRTNVNGMLSKIFDYCLYNSYDFQLAGYSFDLCLTDLRKLKDQTPKGLKAAFKELSKTLFDALPVPGEKPSAEARLAAELILLAHWEAQSYFEENYVDLCDFCFCLHRKCEKIEELLLEKRPVTIVTMKTACEGVMNALESDKGGLIARSGFAGPTYQYSHGLSIFFPWSEPIGSDMWKNQYKDYSLMMDTNQAWKEFLERYFASTQRRTQAEERYGAGLPVPRLNPDAELLEQMSGLVFNAYGQLKDDADDKTDKDHKDDPTGAGCVCPSIKNYPPFTRSKVPVSEKFFEHIKLL